MSKGRTPYEDIWVTVTVVRARSDKDVAWAIPICFEMLRVEAMCQGGEAERTRSGCQGARRDTKRLVTEEEWKEGLHPSEIDSIGAVMRAYPRIGTHRGAVNQCLNICVALTGPREETGHVPLPADSRIIWLVEHRKDPACDPNGEGRGANHAVVYIRSRLVLDLTRRQYEPDDPFPKVYRSLAEAGEDWCYWQDDPHVGRGDLKSLPYSGRASIGT